VLLRQQRSEGEDRAAGGRGNRRRGGAGSRPHTSHAQKRAHGGEKQADTSCAGEAGPPAFRRRAGSRRAPFPAATTNHRFKNSNSKPKQKIKKLEQQTRSARNENITLPPSNSSNIVIMPSQRTVNVIATLWVIVSGFTEVRSKRLLTPSSNHNLLRNAVSLGVQSAIETNFLLNARKMSAQIGTSQQRRKQYTSVINKSPNMSSSITSAKATTYSTAPRASTAAMSSSNLSTPLNNNYHRIIELNGGSELACRSLEFWENMVCGAISRSGKCCETF